MARLSNIWGRIAELIREAEGLEFTYEEVQKDFACILERVGQEVKEYLDRQSVADCMIYMDESFNVLSFVPVVMGMAITHHSLLTSLWVNVSHIPLKILLSPLTFDTMAASGQMALLSYVAQQGVAIREKQAQLNSCQQKQIQPSSLTLGQPQVRPNQYQTRW